jgi:hypothetical protein
LQDWAGSSAIASGDVKSSKIDFGVASKTSTNNKKTQEFGMTETEGNLIEALDEVQDLHDERITALERRVDALEKLQAQWISSIATAHVGSIIDCWLRSSRLLSAVR